jgi:hypothetical protein
LLVEQALIESKTPFHMIFDEHLETLSPSTCKVLVLPNSECLSDRQIASIRRFVNAGGGLIATEQTGLYDLWRRVRLTPGLQELLPEKTLGKPYQEDVVGGTQAVDDATKNVNASTELRPAEQITRREVGRGRVAYLPAVEFDGAMPKAEPYFTIGTALWKRPKNWRQLTDAIAWVSRGDIPLEVQGPDYLIANVVEQPGRHRRLLHLVNCDTEHVAAIDNVKVRCAMASGDAALTVKFYTPDSTDVKSLKFENRDGMVEFTVPSFKVYGVVELSA